MPILTATGLVKAYGPRVLLSGVDVSVHRGDRLGLVGDNGTGKSTLARILVGLESPDEGEVARRRDARIRYLAQEPDLPADKTAREVVREGLGAWAVAVAAHERASEALASGEGDMAALLEAQGAAAAEVERLGGFVRDHDVESVMGHLGLHQLDQLVSTMSGGERRRVALAQLLVEAPDLAVLDEPTNHLDADTIEWLEEYLATTFPGAVLLVTHDRYVLDRVAQKTLELDQGALRVYDGGWSAYLEAKAERLAHEARSEQNRQNLLRTELDWLRRSPSARTTKSQSRVQRAEALRDQKGPVRRNTVTLDLETTRLGKTVVDLVDLRLDVGGRRLVDGLDLSIGRGDRIGILGPNGAGKTSLLRALIGELAPAAGEVVVGKNTQFAYFDQGRSGLVDDQSIVENVAGKQDRLTVGGRVIDVRTYLARFLFHPDRIRQSVGALSGGERARVALAKLLLSPANVLLLDEPTNDLDVSTLGALEQMILDTDATVVVVTHDRYFLDRIATATLVFDGDGHVVRYAGGYTDTLAQRRAAEEARAEEARAKEAAARESQAPPPRAKPRPGKKGLSYKEERELEELPSAIEAAEERVSALDAELSDPEVYARRGGEVPALVEEQTRLRAEVERLMARWEELEEKKAAEA